MLINALAAALLLLAEPGVDTSIHPGDDFFAYANGAWLKATEIPAGSGRWNVRNEINALTRQQVDQLIDGAAAAPAGSDARKVADFRAAYLNETAIEARGIAPLVPLFQRIDGVHDKTALTQLLGSELRADVDPINWGVYNSASLLGLSLDRGSHGENHYVAFLLQGGLSLPDRQHYLDQSADTQALRAGHQERIARVLDLAGFDRAAQRAEAVMALEIAIAQPPKFDPAASDAANYGAIGAIVGHEVCHFFDCLGADYDAAGRKVRWWTAADLAQYHGASEALVQQFAKYHPFPDLAVDGKLTLVENFADLAGLTAAFDAHRRTLGARSNDQEYVRQQDRQFFIGFARAWRGKYRDDALRAQLATDGHAPERFRIATVRNLDAWYEAFGVSPEH